MKNNLLQIILISFFLLIFSGPQAGRYLVFSDVLPALPQEPPFLSADRRWADSVMEQLSLQERIAQMIMVYAYSNMGREHEQSVLRQIANYNIGGILFFQGEPETQARMTNLFQDASEVPLLIAIDGENGLGMRLRKTITYPPAMTLGAISDQRLIYRLGNQMGAQLKRLGIHMNLAPVADINNNPANPVIGSRSFGEERENVAGKVVEIMRGMQDQGILVVAKHFPGHGDTDTDSHRSLPVIPHSRSRLDSVELFPFNEAIVKGLSGIMVAHLNVPAIDRREGRATTLSAPAIKGLLKDEMGFSGLVISDALNMKGIGGEFGQGELELEAVRAGNDIILMPSDVERTISMVERAVREGMIEQQQIDESCRKILQAKYWAGLARREPVKTDSLIEELNRPAYSSLYRELVQGSLCLLKNNGPVIPIRDLPSCDLATVTIGAKENSSFAHTTDLYLTGTHYTLADPDDAGERMEMIRKLRSHNTIVINIWNTSRSASRNWGISEGTVDFIGQLDTTSSLILNLAGHPYALSRFTNLNQLDAVILSHDDDPLYQDAVAQAVFGGIPFSGKLPVSAGGMLSAGTGIRTGSATRLGYAFPEDVGMSGDSLERIEKIIQEAIGRRAVPGCQVLVARRGKVIWHRAYGFHTYRKNRAVELTDLYDLASVTKIASTMAALMRLRDQGLFHEDSLMGSYGVVPEGSDKATLRTADVLTHQAGLQAWIPFYRRTLDPLDSVYQKHYSPEFPVRVAEDLFMRKTYIDSVYRWVYESELRSGEYLYSSLGFFMLHRIIESVTDTLLYPYVRHHFYAPLGARTLGYLPLERFERERIVPTENDRFYRRQLLQGYVHDMEAAMLGGVSGNAGLFSCANDLAKMMQMYLNGGWYGEKRYIDAETLALYTSCYLCDEGNRRGLGFDKPVIDGTEESPACVSASASSFGHSGFTGNLAWADPDQDLLFVFLSNRIHPDQDNDRLIEMNIRTRIQQVVYDAILDHT